jgi:hypothetical protein
MPIQLQYRRDTAANWTSANPTLLSGEPGYETDTGKFKIGDGSSAWTALAYYGAAGFNYGNNIEVYTTGTAASWTVPTALRYTAATSFNGLPGQWKVTLVGGGGAGGGTATVAGQVGNGGGSAGVIVSYYTYVSAQNTMTYTIGAGGTAGAAGAAGNAGAATTTVYNSVTYSAGGGSGGANQATVNGGGAGGTNSGAAAGTGSFTGNKGDSGGTTTATLALMGSGGATPLGFGWGGQNAGTAAGSAGILGQGFGAGGSGARNGSGTTSQAGGAGAPGILIIEY